VKYQTVFVTLVSTFGQGSAAKLLIDSVRSFAGPMRNFPIWLFAAGSQEQDWDDFKDIDVEVIPLNTPVSVKQNWFARKVYACARAEELAGTNLQSLIWMSTDCLVIQPPVLFELGSSYDIALRPVHVRNIGLLASESPDEFWKRIYQAVGVDDIQVTVESFVDEQSLRAYYNSHAFAINPSIGLMSKWYETFESLVQDQDFQSGACCDELHQIFLHQAVLSALVATCLDPDRILMLPPTYNYPYNLQDQVPANKRAVALNDLACITYEDRSLNPYDVMDIRIDDPFRSWLTERTVRKSESYLTASISDINHRDP
jgi:hypothetical protein